MANDFYNHATYPSPNSAGSSANMRAELELITAGFNKLPTLTGNGYKVVGVNSTGTALESDPKLMNVDFSTTNVAAGAVGRLTWNDTDGTLDLGLKGGNVTLQLGQEQNVRIYNETASGFVDMQVVRITGSSGTRLTADLAQANAENTSASTLAIMTEPAASHAEGFATTFGLIRQVNTSAFAEGATLYLSPTTAGGITTTRPSAPNHTVILGWCVRSHATQGAIYVNINNGYELDELHDVSITSVAAYNMLRRNSANTVWENIAGPSGAIVGTTDTQTLTNKTFSGGTVTGAAVTGLSTPSGSSDAATKGYVDTGLALKLNLSGGTMSGAIAMGTNKITGMGDPTAAQDAATKSYVDTLVQGLDPKASVRVATTANITLSGTQTIDGIALSVGDRVLVKDQTTAANNGIYLVAAGAWTRTTDADTWNELVSAFTFVEVGTTNANNGFTCTVAAGGTLGSTAITWVQFSGAGQINAGAGLTKTGNTLDVGTASISRIVVNANDIDLATTGVTAGSYGIITVDAYGRATGGSNPTTLAGYGIANAYTKTEVDGFVNAKLNLSGGTMTGAIAMGGNKITGLGAPTTDNDAVTLKYVSDLYGSTASAAASAAAALVSQNAAAASASAASTSATNAASSASSASTSATSASGSATAAAASAVSALSSLNSFVSQYYGPLALNPALDPLGNAVTVGDLYFNTSALEMRTYNGSAWVSASVIGGTVASINVTGSTTLGQNPTLSGGTANGVAYLNGSKVVTTGSALTFDGTKFSVLSSSSVNVLTATFTQGNSDPNFTLGFRNGSGASASTEQAALSFDYAASKIASIGFVRGGGANAEAITFGLSSEQMRLTSTGLGIGTSSPGAKLEVAGGAIALANNQQLQWRTSGGSLAAILKLNASNNVEFGDSQTSSQAMVLASGNLGLGVTPSAWYSSARALQIGAYSSLFQNASGYPEIAFNTYQSGASTFTYIASDVATRYNQTNGAHSWWTAPSGTAGNPIVFKQAMTLDASGRLLQGTTSSKAYVSNTTNADWSTVVSVSNSGTSFDSSIGNLAIDNPDTTANNFSRLAFTTNDGSNRVVSAGIYAQITARSAGNWTTSNLQFFTGATGAAPTEKARIDSSGNLLVATTSAVDSGKISVLFDNSSANGLSIKMASTTYNNNLLSFRNSSNTQVGYIYSAGTGTTYSTSSDYRLKENIAPMADALATVAQLKPCTYTWKADGSFGQGFIAHELQAVVPDAVVGEKDAVNEDGSIRAQGIDTSFLVATLTAAIQEQQAIIQQLQADVAALKGA